MSKPSVTRRVASLLILALVTAGCGLLGDDDAPSASNDPDEVEATIPIVRVSDGGDRWFEVRETEVDAGFEETLPTKVAALDIEFVEPSNASVRFRDGAFEAVDGSFGRAPDFSALGLAIREALASGTTEISVPYEDVTPEVTVQDAAVQADTLNRRIAEGVTVSIDTESDVLSANAIGTATDVDWAGDQWDVTVRWEDVAAEVESMFPDVGAEGGEASFTVTEETEDQPAKVRIVSGEPTTICCDSTSARRLEQVLEQDVEVARLFLKSVESERGREWANDLEITELVGTFTTRYTPGQDRVKNIRRFGELVQGVIIEPGETFSLNGHVGQRTREKGFYPAGTIVNGHLVDSVGGGISQFATTIFNASFFAGLEFETYQSHSIYFSRYPYGREATISWPNPDLKIHNPTPYGVLLWPTSTASSITVDIYSTEWAPGEQTGQWETAIQQACTRVTTERTRTWVEDGHTETDTVFATYRPEGIACDGTETQNPNEEQLEKLENGEDPDFQPGSTTTTTTTVAPSTTSTTAVAPTTTTSTSTTTTTTSTSTTTTTTSTSSTTTSSTVPESSSSSSSSTPP